MVPFTWSDEYVPISDIEQYMFYIPAATTTDWVVLHLHGGPGESAVLSNHLVHLRQPSVHYVYYDQRGAGKTQQRNHSKPADVTINRLIADLKETIAYCKRRFDTGHIILLGHSWGTVLGSEYVSRYPHDVSAYIGMGQVVGMVREEAAAYQHLCELIAANGNQADKDELTALGDYPHSLTPETFGEAVLAFRKLEMKWGMAGTRLDIATLQKSHPCYTPQDEPQIEQLLEINNNLMTYLTDYDRYDRIHFDLPVYGIAGVNDWQVPGVLAAAYWDRIQAPDKQFYWIEDAGHLTDAEQPEAFHSVINAILQRLQKR